MAHITPLLARRLPVGRVLVRRLEPAAARMETAARGTLRRDPGPEIPQTELAAAELDALATWCRHGRPLHRQAGALARERPGLLPPGIAGDVLAAPLRTADDTLAALALVSHASGTFDAKARGVLAALLDPVAVAVENDRRVCRLRSLREAAEADRRALLQRLGRSDLQETVVGAEGGLRAALERAAQAATTDVPVLILGETGSGKEVIARTIHRRSRRARGPFLRVSCGAIPEALADRALFGHEDGTSTGATPQRTGAVARAESGTLFLDEVGEIPLPTQEHLLRVLRDGIFERTGGRERLHADVRVVAATQRDLHAMVSEGRFREDLWYRLAAFPIHLPPLRDRLEDLPALATHFALRAATRFGTTPLAPSPEDVSLLAAYAWPANLRELSNVMERAVILGGGRRLEIAKALGDIGPPASAPPDEATAAPLPSAPARLDAAIAQHIEAALLRCHGRIEGPFGAAAFLGVNPHTLRARMRRLGIDWKRFRPRR